MKDWNVAEKFNNVTRDLFNAIFRNEDNVFSKSIVKRTIQQFVKTSIIKDRPKPGKPGIAILKSH